MPPDPIHGRSRRCPGCGEPMRSWRLGALEVDGCDTCGGCWFDGRELTSATALEGHPLEALEAEFTPGLAAGAGGGARRCPQCHRDLERFSFPHAPGVQLDGCRGCGGIWFDEGELQTLAARLPRHARPRADEPEALAAVAVGTVRQVPCKGCGAANPEAAETCRCCGLSLVAPPPRRDDDLVSVHRLRFGYVIGELLLFAFLAWSTIDGIHSRRGGHIELPAEAKAPVLIALGLLLAVRWAFRKLAVEVRTDGLLVRTIFVRRWVPWSSLRGGAVFDLGGRAIWSASEALRGFGRYGRYPHGGRGWSSGGLSHRDLDDFGEERGRAMLVLWTSRGPITFGPDLGEHFALIDAIRKCL